MNIVCADCVSGRIVSGMGGEGYLLELKLCVLDESHEEMEVRAHERKRDELVVVEHRPVLPNNHSLNRTK